MDIQSFAKKIVRLNHDSFRIDAASTIYIDPYQITSDAKADIILVTHDHFDHCSPEDIAKIQTDQTVIVTEKDSAKKLAGDVRILSPGQSVTIGDVAIEAVPAYNVNKTYHPKQNGWLGFIIGIEGMRIYHAGDTDVIPEMETFQVDIALLPVSGTYVMTAEEAVKAARAIKPKLVIPMHYGAIVGDDRDAERFKAALEGEMSVLVQPN